ncbi:MAG: SGNH/GDSL hydrolase family protein [Abitibacteriaceae bacterium]|nr:SGNH/GDSL hydrolase family protein [Abditibacteriaceae bacterium]
MSFMRRLLSLCALMLMCLSTAHAQGNFYLRNGDRVVFYGDSITDQRLYTTFAETYVVTRFPQLNVSFVHSGWGGDRVGGGGGGPIDLRLQRDVIAYKPTVMTIMLGMNDASYKAYDQGTFDTYAKGYQHIIDTVKQALPGIRITAIQPSPFDDVTQAPKFEGGYNAVLVRYGQYLKDLAQKQNLNLADLNTPVVADLEKAKATDAALAQKIIPDRVHPGPGGHLIMAEALLKAWNAPAIVTNVEIDANGQRVVRSDNTRVTGLAGGNNPTWMQSDNALPMPVNMGDPVIALAVNSSDFTQALNQEPLKVTGLTAAKYTLKIDGQDVGIFTKEQLADGINLATQQTPMSKQAANVHGLTVRHDDIHTTRWRQYQVPMANDNLPHLTEVMRALDDLEADVVAQQRAAAQPVPHRYELVAQP